MLFLYLIFIFKILKYFFVYYVYILRVLNEPLVKFIERTMSEIESYNGFLLILPQYTICNPQIQISNH